jgi:membrane-associated HD superfamily phosphohydrolase
MAGNTGLSTATLASVVNSNRFLSAPKAADALSSLGGDLTIAIAFAIARELTSAADEAQMNDSELVAVVLLIAILLSSMPVFVEFAEAEVGVLLSRVLGRTPTRETTSTRSGLLQFFGTAVSVAHRVAMATIVSLVAANVTESTPFRSARILSLVSIATFFVFVQKVSAIGTVKNAVGVYA